MEVKYIPIADGSFLQTLKYTTELPGIFNDFKNDPDLTGLQTLTFDLRENFFTNPQESKYTISENGQEATLTVFVYRQYAEPGNIYQTIISLLGNLKEEYLKRHN